MTFTKKATKIKFKFDEKSSLLARWVGEAKEHKLEENGLFKKT